MLWLCPLFPKHIRLFEWQIGGGGFLYFWSLRTVSDYGPRVSDLEVIDRWPRLVLVRLIDGAVWFSTLAKLNSRPRRAPLADTQVLFRADINQKI
jgi:hypothetical protein